MAIDPRIALGVQPVQIQSPLQNFGQALQLKDLIGQQDMRALQMREYERKVGRENALRDLMMQHNGDRAKVVPALRAGGFYQEADEMEKTGAEIGYKTAQANEIQNKIVRQMQDDLYAAIGSATDQQSYDRALGMFASKYGEGASKILAQVSREFSPSARMQVLQQIEIAKNGGAAVLPKISYRNTGKQDVPVDTNIFTNPNPQALTMTTTPGDDQRSRDAAAGRAVTMRGQDLADRRAAESNSINAGKNVLETADRLRVEFNKLPEVEAYKSVIPAQKSAQEAIARDTPQADMNLIYATAKIFDPTSVVREGEYATVNASQSPAERMQGMLSYLMGGGRLTANTRRQLLDEINSRGAAAKTQYDAARKSYEEIAKRRNADPAMVFQSLDEAEQQPRGVTQAEPKKEGATAPPPEAKPVTVNGQRMTAIRAPDGKYYVRQANGKYAEVIEDGAATPR